MKMDIRLIAMMWLALTMASGPMLAQKRKVATPKLPDPVKVTTVEGITEYRLANGLRVLLFPDPTRSTITVNITYLVGSRHEGYGESGMAHLLEHLLFKGSPKHPNIPQEMTARGAQPNGTTWYDRTNYFETFNASEDNLRWALSLESDRMVNAFLRAEDLQSEFSVVRNEFEMGENDPAEILEERVMATAYLWHNYGKATIGSKEDIEKVPIENLRAFYKKYYQPDNAVLIITGKIDEAATIRLVNEYFGPIPRPDRKLPAEYTVEPVQDGERMVTLRRVGDVQIVSCGYHIPAGSHPDFVAIEICNDVLTNVPSGRLYRALVEAQKATSISGRAYALKHPGYFYLSAEVPKDKSLDEAKTTMLATLDELPLRPITQEEFDRARTKLLKQYELMYNNSLTVGLVLSEFVGQGDWRLWFLYRDRLEQITLDQVNQAISAYLKPSNRVIGLFIPESNPQRAYIPPPLSVEELVQGYQGKQQVSAGEEFDVSYANIDARTITGQIPGGAKYAFLPKETRGGMVHLNMTLRLGSEPTLAGKGAVARMTARMLRRGTTSRTFQQINDLFDQLKANVSITGSGQLVQVQVSTVRDSLVKVLAVVHDVLRNPSFPEEEFQKLLEQMLTEIDQQRSDPQSVAFNQLNRLLSPYDKEDFRYIGTFDEQMEALRRVTVDELRRFHSQYYNGTHATVAVVGSFDVERVREALTSLLSNWTAPVSYERARDRYFPVAAQEIRLVVPDKANAVFVAGTNLQLRDDHPDYPALLLGNFMLGGGFLNSRLATRIRQKEGLSYGVASWLTAQPLDEVGRFGSFAIYNPDNAQKLLSAYWEEIHRMLNEGFSESEVSEAIAGYIDNQKVNRTRDNFLASELNTNLFLNRNMRWYQGREEQIRALTAQTVNAAMRKWVDTQTIATVLVGDFARTQE